MRLSPEELSRIVERASRLIERLDGSLMPVPGDETLARQRLVRWKKVAAHDDPLRFAEVLRGLGVEQLSEADLLARLGRVQRPSSAPFPSWALLLEKLIAQVSDEFTAAKSDARSHTRRFARRGGIPYEHLLQPIADFALDRVQSQVQSFAPAVRRGLQAYLMGRLANIVALLLHFEFLAYKAFATPHAGQPLSKAHQAEEGIVSHELYRAFILDCGRGGLKNFFVSNPTAARLVAEVTGFWIEFVGEILRRLDLDADDIAREFNRGNPPGRLEGVRAGISDAHHQGRCVVILTFEHGLRVVYKPRAMGTDRLFFDLLTRLNNEGFTPNLRPSKVLSRPGYGWMEFASFAPCSSEAAAKQFYRRAGALVCLVHRLGGIDCGRENMVAAGEHPSLIDLEALAHPALPHSSSQPPPVDACLFGDSLLRSGMLPFWQLPPKGKSLYDNTALGAPTRQRSLLATIRWTGLGTDQLHYEFRQRIFNSPSHRPRLACRVLTVQHYAEQVVSGHSAMADLLNGSVQADFNAFSTQIRHTTRRWIKRPTMIYGVFLQRSLRPEHLVEGIDRSIALQGLPPQPWIDSAERACEIKAMERLDVPYFHVEVAPTGHNPMGSPITMGDSHQLIEMLNASLQREVVLVDGRVERLRHRKALVAATS